MELTKKAAKTRVLDLAMGGDEVPEGPLGGPEYKTREEMVVEENEKVIAEAEAEIASVTPPDPPPEDTTQGGLAGRVGDQHPLG